MSEEVNDRGVLVMARLIDLLAERQARSMAHTTESRDTYSDGFASGLSEAFHIMSASIRADVKNFDQRIARLET